MFKNLVHHVRGLHPGTPLRRALSHDMPHFPSSIPHPLHVAPRRRIAVRNRRRGILDHNAAESSVRDVIPLAADSLPTELWVSIFAIGSGDEAPNAGMPFTLAISQVCRAWRRLVHSFSSLWTSVYVPLAPSYQHWPYATLATQLRRSGDLLIDVIITALFDTPTDSDLYCSWRGDWQRELPAQLIRVGRQLTPHAQRIRSLRIELPLIDPGSGIWNLFGSDVHMLGQLTRLEVLGGAQSHDTWSPPSVTLYWNSLCLPRLEAMRLQGVSFIWDGPDLFESAGRHLVHLDLGWSHQSVKYSELASALGDDCQLESLIIAVKTLEIFEWDVSAGRHLTLSRLHTLRLHEREGPYSSRYPGPHEVTAVNLFVLLVMPVLRTLELEGNGTPVEFLTLLSEGNAPFARLKHLRLMSDVTDLENVTETARSSTHGLCQIELHGLSAAEAALALTSPADRCDESSPGWAELSEEAHLRTSLLRQAFSNIEKPLIQFSVPSPDIVVNGGIALRAGVVAWLPNKGEP
jgi:hypothetical protein